MALPYTHSLSLQQIINKCTHTHTQKHILSIYTCSFTLAYIHTYTHAHSKPDRPTMWHSPMVCYRLRASSGENPHIHTHTPENHTLSTYTCAFISLSQKKTQCTYTLPTHTHIPHNVMHPQTSDGHAHANDLLWLAHTHTHTFSLHTPAPSALSYIHTRN